MPNYNALLVGNGGREHELARQLDLSSDVGTVYWTRPNAAAAILRKVSPVDINPTDVNGIEDFVRQERPGLTVIGSEAPLALGVADRIRVHGLAVFGPSAEAARIEVSKIFATEFMERNGIPIPPSWVVHTLEQGMTVVRRIGVANSVLKADGLAAGKGVVLPEDEQIAELTIHGMLSGEKFDGAGSDGIVIQERYHGPELSVMVISDGQKIKILPAAQDHKRLLDGDKGPNTGGMGAYAPVPPTIVTASQWVKIEEIAQRTIDAMAYEGKPFVGCLFMGLMLAEERDGDPVVIEFNARLGDPETEAILPILERGGLDVADMLRSSAEGQLRDYSWNRELGGAALSVCLAAEGYPDNPKKGDIIYGLGGDYPNVIVHQAGTQLVDGKAVTSGGRVGYVTGLGKDIDAAAASAYAVIDAKKVTFAGAQYRDDIGHQARQTT